MEAFELALEVADLADDLALEHRRMRPWLADQVGRAGLSVLNNTAEGASEHSPGDKARFYRYALRSAGEFGAMIVHMVRKVLLTLEAEIGARRLLVKTMKVLGRMARFFQNRAADARRER